MAGQDDLYQQASDSYGSVLRRLVRGYEADPERRRDLLQDIHIELWRSLRLYDGRCSLRQARKVAVEIERLRAQER